MFAPVRDGIIGVAGLWLALLLRYDAHIPFRDIRHLLVLSPIAFVAIVWSGSLLGLYMAMPGYTSLGELWRLAETIAVESIFLAVMSVAGHGSVHLIPLSVPLTAAFITFLALTAARLVNRLPEHIARRGASDGAIRMLIVGAGGAGEMVARDLLRHRTKFTIVGFLDDDPQKLRKRIHGVPIVGTTDDLASIVERLRIEHVVIAMPNVPSRITRKIVERVAATGVKAKMLPSIPELIEGSVTAADLRDVDVADLIGREPVQLDTAQVAGYVEGRRVLITGAAGSIGSELVRQVLRFKPSRVLLLDSNETELFYLAQDLSFARGLLTSLLADVRDRVRVEAIFAEHRPEVVFHAAAYKHVPMMEVHADEAVLTNITGTRNVVNAAIEHGAERFILVSTDKAVNPVNVMGATKRVAELLIQRARSARTTFAAVRFGNVLGSRGSVVPIFVRQIEAQQPLTVTHPEATRYFMTIEEAASLIIQAGALAGNGETFVLDMGDPVRIHDLALRMRDLLGGQGRDQVEVVFTGLRPGEKLHEDLWHARESLTSSGHPRIFRVATAAEERPGASFDHLVVQLERLAADHGPGEEIRRLLGTLCARDLDHEVTLLNLDVDVAGRDPR